MILKCVLLFCVMVIVNSDNMSSDEYMDTLIGFLINEETVDYDENIDEAEPFLVGNEWKCGNCDNIDDKKLVYSETNDVQNNIDGFPIEIQVGVAVPNMRCVSVKADLSASVVKKVAGSCGGGAVTLSVAPPQHFVVNVYS